MNMPFFCHAQSPQLAVVQKRDFFLVVFFLDQGSLVAPAHKHMAANDADYMKHMLVPKHRQTLSHSKGVKTTR